ncbi:hypothetical protein [Devosia ginsengisoli]|uniref:hypothetical protein n=1 Tax=Devosia ginsengisoli TaxID=400770 RepID=UPI0026F0AA46|nr:hypothetical protein [Devosia ginsengisoli]MCR6669915.1 hypothetical protein [Devosia ginsengisoli]
MLGLAEKSVLLVVTALIQIGQFVAQAILAEQIIAIGAQAGQIAGRGCVCAAGRFSISRFAGGRRMPTCSPISAAMR